VPTFFYTLPFVVVSIVCGAVGAVFVLAAIVALLKLRPLRFMMRTFIGALLLVVGVLFGAIGFGMAGYRELTKEVIAARILVRPAGAQRFTAIVHVPDRPEMTFELAGDEIYVDAHILKWKSMANVFGLQTAYELDRVAGRYRSVTQERGSDRTIYSLSEEKPVDLFDLRRQHAFLAPLLDAEYGSGTFVPVTKPAEFEVRVSTSGLLIRPAR
jgi:hypothetical protein